MITIPIVKEHEFDKAREMEARLLELPESSGILFVGVSVVPGLLTVKETDSLGKAFNSKSVFKVAIGVQRSREEDAVIAVARVILRDLVPEEQLAILVFRGIGRGINQA